jgi:serine protease Do
LRTSQPGDPLAVDVLRFASQERLTGQINGRELAPVFSFLEQRGDQINTVSVDNPANAGYTSYRTITDVSRVLRVDVPDAWGENTGYSWEENNQIIGVSITAAPTLDGFYTTWQTPGIFIGVSAERAQTMDVETQLDLVDFSRNCALAARDQYQSGHYQGLYDIWTNCGNTPTDLYVLSLAPDDNAFLALMQVQVVSDADLEALDRIVASFDVVGALP